ncbi:MAG: peptide deformylase [Candidatus Omnitrophica bacterium]|nr:peptide deformylase [Candidatus Omnitrophota bacterium]MBU4477989.1 peptide deformylase [Candidatus Omnitrophota bacterium]MCG2704187.1 peptide deformylase [Candidatus Omnitrophota bacterium]
MYTIFKNKNPVLRKKAAALKRITNKELMLMDEMLKIMYRDKGIGLAAPQVGISKQIIVIDIGEGPLKLFNPRIIRKKGEMVSLPERCLSLPGLSVKVKRPKKVLVEACTVSGEKILIEAEDLLARVLQHEIDHLHGRLIIDYLPWYRRRLLLK